MINSIINSTLDKKSKAILKETIAVDSLIAVYKSTFNIDVQKYFKSYDNIYLFECQNTKFQFYYPFGVGGDSSFYEQLQSFEWYYMPWKWEHETAKSLMKGGETILEVGCGGLGFIQRMQNEDFNIFGLELNEDCVLSARQKQLKVYNETIQNHVKSHIKFYDVICSFQVLEHISDVRSFIQAQIDCLKEDGKLIVAVPDNDSFIKYTGGGLLNKPPHHMGLWNKTSLIGLAKCFNLNIEKIYYEPLQDYHFKWYVESIINSKIKPYRILNKVFKKFKLRRFLYRYVRMNQKNIKGHTMLVVYTKV